MSQQQEINARSWMISFGIGDIPCSIRNAIPGFIKMETPANEKKTRRFVNEEKRKLLLENIDLALQKNIFESLDIWVFLIHLENETGQEIILRNREGGLMAANTFRQYVLIQKRATKVKKPSVRDKILVMHSKGLSDIEIRTELNCTEAHIRRCLIDAGLLEKTTPAKRKKSNVKRKSY